MCLALLKMTLGHDETAILKQKPGVLQTFGSFFIKNTAKIGRGSWSVCPLASTYLSMPRELVPSSLTIGRILDLDRLSNYWIKILKIFTGCGCMNPPERGIALRISRQPFAVWLWHHIN